MSNFISFCRFLVFALIIFVSHNPLIAQGPPGYTYAAGENQFFVLPQLSHVAFGANGAFNYRFNQTGTVTFNTTTFGDPIFGVGKSGYYKITNGTETVQTLINAFQQLRNHCNNITVLTPVQINSLADSIQQNVFLIADNSTVILAAFDVVNCYEANVGPIFLPLVA